jgi:hypothetical protein
VVEPGLIAYRAGGLGYDLGVPRVVVVVDLVAPPGDDEPGSAELTGRSTRDHRATLALYLACLADQLDDGTRT